MGKFYSIDDDLLIVKISFFEILSGIGWYLYHSEDDIILVLCYHFQVIWTGKNDNRG